MNDAIRILLVEDSEDDAALVISFLQKYRKVPDWRRVETELQMRNALRTGSWDLVIADYHLPTFSGPEAMKVLKSMDLDVPLIIVSGAVGEDTAVELLQNGATDFVLKGNLGRLPSAIDRAIREVQSRRQQKAVEEQLIEAQKLESIGRLAGGIAHDVNNVLSAIALFAEMALDQIQGKDPAQARVSLQGILKAQDSAASIIRQLLLFSRRRTSPAQIVNFGSILEGVQTLVARLIGENIALEIQTPSEPAFVLADKTQLEQIVLNLAANARDAMPSGGKLKLNLEIQNVEVTPTDVRIPIQPGKYCILTATDSGCGMSPEVLKKLFEPFFTTKDPGKGTGLGLPVVYGIVSQAQGTLAVKSAPGQGTSFQIYWPVAVAEQSDSVGVRTNSQPEALNTVPLLVLLVEDEESLRKILSKTLRRQGHSVLEAANGEEALEILLSHREKISLLVTDVVMPHLNGPELAMKARELKPDLAVLFLTGYVDRTLQEMNLDLNSTWFLEKPFTSLTLAKKVEEVISESEPAGAAR